jgi:hypothetical protein
MMTVYNYLFQVVYNFFCIRVFEEMIGRGREVGEEKKSGLSKNKVRKQSYSRSLSLLFFYFV